MSGGFRVVNARVVTPEAVILGGVEVEDGRITAVVPDARAGGVDFAGDYLLPGLVEVHTDNLERQFQPRPKVRWPADAAVLAHDGQMAAAGCTTVCDAVCVGFYGDKDERLEILSASIEATRAAAEAGSLRAEHRLHLRCELTDPSVVDLFGALCSAPDLALVSLMDHTPGQRQWHDIAKYRTFQMGRTVNDEAGFQKLLAQRRGEQANVLAHRAGVLDLLRGRKVALASHDDTTPEHVAEGAADGVTVSEFPTTLVAALAARAAGMSVVMGAPNVVLGGSQSGNVSALDLAERGLLDVMSSDYVPVSLLHAAFRLHDVLGLPLHEAVAPVTRNPAALLGLDDRGAVAEGLRADLARVRRTGDVPGVTALWRAGRRVA